MWKRIKILFVFPVAFLKHDKLAMFIQQPFLYSSLSSVNRQSDNMPGTRERTNEQTNKIS